MKRMPVAEFRRELHKVIEAAERGESTIILRRGKAVAVIGPVRNGIGVEDGTGAQSHGGLLAVAGLLANWETIDADMAEVIAMRQATKDRPAPNFD